MSIRTRFAPSPTGYLHIGGARTALFNWLYAKKHGGTFILRIEDTDRERSTEESVQAILDGMTWLGMDYQEGPFYQTHRFDRYKEIIQQLMDNGHAYYCYCSKEELDALREEQMKNGEKPRYDGRYRDFDGTPPEGVDPVIRFRNPLDGEVVIDDMVKGQVVVQNSELDDLIIARSDGTPTYNLTVVVDDLDMGLTHVVRGDDHLNNTPRQINILKALGAEPPKYAHLPMILGSDGARLSKRHGAVSVMQYRDDGYMPEAMLNYLVRLGWSHGDQELFSVDEMVDLFDVVNVNKAPSSFNEEKLQWVNHQYIMNTDPAVVAKHLQWHLDQRGLDVSDGPAIEDVIVALRERTQLLTDMADQAAMFYRDYEAFDEKAAKKHLRPVAKEALQAMQAALRELADWDNEALKQCVHDVAEQLELKMGKVGMPLRVAVTGQGASPDIDVTLKLIGRDACVRRIDMALAYIAEREANA